MSQAVPEQTQTLGYLLRTSYELLQHQVYASLGEAGHPAVREAHSSVLRYLPLDGARMSDLAKRAGISKQSIAYLVDDLLRLGYVEMQDDPTDGRAKLVRFSERGRELVALLSQQSAEAEQACARVIGKEQMVAMREALGMFIRRQMSKE